MKLSLDTNIVSKIMRGREPLVRANFGHALERKAHIEISVIVYLELRYGALRSPFPVENMDRVHTFVQSISGVVDFIPEDAEIAAHIWARLAKQGALIGPHDTLIAAQAFRTGSTMVTGNTGEFERIEELRTIDWTKS